MPPQFLPAWLEQTFRWLNYPVAHYWVLAAASLVLVVVLAWFASPRAGAPRRWWQAPWVFGVAVVFCLAAFRWPTWFVQDEFNPDESQIIAGALTLRSHPVYWRDVDAMTQGPLNAYALTAAALAGLPLNFFGARVFALALQAAALLATRAALARRVTESSARLGLVAPLAFWALTSHHDFLHYSSELVSLALLAAAGWALAAALAAADPAGRSRAAGLFLAGAALGLVPFAKLQGVPPAAALAAVGLVALSRGPGGRRWRDCGWLVAGGVAVPLIVVALVIAAGEAAEAWQAYIRNNLWYVKTAPASAGPVARLLDLANGVPAFRAFWWGSLAAIGAITYPAWRSRSPGAKANLAVAWWLAGAAILAVLGPGRSLPHYLEFLVLPLGVLGAVHLHAIDPAGPANRAGFNWRGAWTAGFFLLALGPQLGSRAQHPHIYAGQFMAARYDHRPSQAAYFIRQRAAPGDAIATWGWRPQLYVETGLPQGTREAQTERQLSLDPAVQDYYLQRYLRDLRERQPAWFVDAVGPASLGYHDRGVHGHEAFPALAGLVRAEYEYLADIEGLRIYRRRPAPGRPKRRLAKLPRNNFARSPHVPRPSIRPPAALFLRRDSRAG
jgi:hypothetical protein